MEKVLLHKQKHLFVVRLAFGEVAHKYRFWMSTGLRRAALWDGPYEPRTTTYDERLFYDFLYSGYDVFSGETEFLE